MEKIKIGVLGAGKRGKQLIDLFSTAGNEVEVLAICDSNPKAFEQDFGTATTARHYSDSNKLFVDSEVDAIIITTKDNLHEEHACQALNAGKHVFIEKPLAITYAGCLRIIETAKQNRKLLYVGHNLNHFTYIEKIKQLIESGVIGDVKSLWCDHAVSYGLWAFFQYANRWQSQRENVGSLMIHKGSHAIGVIQWLCGSRAKRVISQGGLLVYSDQPSAPDVEDHSSTLLQMENGIQVTYNQCHFSFFTELSFKIFGTRGSLTASNRGRATIQVFCERGKSLLGEVTEEYRLPEEEGPHGEADVRIVEEFLSVLRNRSAPTVSATEAAWVVKTCEAATDSLRNGNIAIDIL